MLKICYNLDKIILLTKFTIMEKSLLMTKAIEAFKEKYGELPADAGYPVVRERNGSVYFARSAEDWHYFVKETKFLQKIFSFILITLLLIFIAVVCGIIFLSNYETLLYAIAAYCLMMLFLWIRIFFHRPKKPTENSEIVSYDNYCKKINIISL